MFGGKGGGLQAKEHHPNHEAWGWQHHVVGLLCSRRDCCTSQNIWHHEGGKLRGYIEATSQDISQEVKAGRKWVFQMDNDPKRTSKVVAKCLKDNNVKELEWPSQRPQSYRKFVGRTEIALTPALSGGMGQNSPNLLWEACGRLHETLTQVKQFKGNATKY